MPHRLFIYNFNNVKIVQHGDDIIYVSRHPDEIILHTKSDTIIYLQKHSCLPRMSQWSLSYYGPACIHFQVEQMQLYEVILQRSMTLWLITSIVHVICIFYYNLKLYIFAVYENKYEYIKNKDFSFVVLYTVPK